ncbi:MULTISPECIES: hypothetical protein [unclassified Pseudomonas]|uniref:hypothetical protein n=1 Tax=unclassified Pseudomonas TaxID=196821 RepID=UPI000A1EFED6|nr:MULTISPECIES: hypothetical protein [unclassified Pseudomonas]MDI2143629.1 hypothetical protein [Pseudomonas sp. ITA]
MNIEIIERRSPHGWVVHMDRLQVNFNSLEQARAFVGQLRARIDAPHTWPQPTARKAGVPMDAARPSVASVD